MPLELGRYSRIGTIIIGTALEQKNFQDDVQTHEKVDKDFRMKPDCRGFILKGRSGHAPSESAIIRWSYYKDKVTDTSGDGDGYITIGAGKIGGETGISADLVGNQRLNVYVTSNVANTIIEVLVYDGFS